MITLETLSTIRILFRAPDSLSLYGIPYQLRPSQAPRDLFMRSVPYGRFQRLEAGPVPVGWIWLGTPGWFGSMTGEEQTLVRAWLGERRERDELPGNAYEWTEIARVTCARCGIPIAPGEAWGDGDANDPGDPSFCGEACYRMVPCHCGDGSCMLCDDNGYVGGVS